MTASVVRDMRHTKSNRCPVCDGADGDARGKSKRCSGFTSSDGDWCHCSREELAGAIEQNSASLFAHRMHGPCNCGTSHGADIRPIRDEIESTYDYTDERGLLRFQVVRKTGKRFLQRRPDGAGGWLWNMQGVDRILYRLPDLVDADNADRIVFVVEGEKDCDRLAAAGHLATTNPGGALKFHLVADSAKTLLADRDVIVIADADEPGRAHARQVFEALRGVARSLKIQEPPSPHKDVSDLLAAGKTVADLVGLTDTKAAEVAPPTGIITVGIDEIFAPLPPIPWIVEGLKLAPGGVTVEGGYGFAGKTVTAQSIGVAVAAGRPVFGLFASKKCRVLHIDYEQGRRVTFDRYQRLARAMGVQPGELDDQIRVAVLPNVYLDSEGAQDVYARAMDGFGLVIIDSLRAATPTADENSSEIRRHLDALVRAAEKTGSLPLVLVHARKPNDGDKGGAKMSIRGSSAIFDACQSLFVLEAEKGAPTRVHHEKERVTGVPVADFGLQVEDVEIGGDPRGGLQVVHLEAEQMGVSTVSATARLDAAALRVLEVVQTNAGASKRLVRELSRGVRAETVDAALERLLMTGRVRNEGTEARAKYVAATGVNQ